MFLLAWAHSPADQFGKHVVVGSDRAHDDANRLGDSMGLCRPTLDRALRPGSRPWAVGLHRTGAIQCFLRCLEPATPTRSAETGFQTSLTKACEPDAGSLSDTEDRDRFPPSDP